MSAERDGSIPDAAFAAQEGTWTLTAPDGRQWQADSPLKVVRDEQAARVPASVRLARIMAAVDEVDAEDAAIQRDAARYRQLATMLIDGDSFDVGEAYVRMKVVGSCPDRSDLDASVDAELAKAAPVSSHNAEAK